MRRRFATALSAVSAVSAVLLMGMPSTASASTGSGVVGLWPTDYSPHQTTDDCGTTTGFLDANGFCAIDDDFSVQLGVRFTTSAPVVVTGVRVYRTDAGSDTGSLWTDDGTLLATGDFAPFSGNDGWQDMTFDNPVTLEPGTTYVASYYAPAGEYAFDYHYFSSTSFSVGPITALQSVADNGNGLFCYNDLTSCFPDQTYLDTNYWVTPLWRRYDFNGFYQPVANGTWNQAKAGSAIPVKFSLGGDMGLDVLESGYPKATEIDCPDTTTSGDPIDTVTAGGSSLTFDATAEAYTYVWKTDKAWAGRCFRFELGLNDNSSHTFDVQFTR